MKTFATSLALLGTALSMFACAPAADSESVAPETQSEELHAARRECTIATVTVKPGLLADFRTAVAPSFIKDYPRAYSHIEIPFAFDAALSGGQYGEWLYTLNGFDIHPEQLAPGSSATPRLVASIDAGPSFDPLLRFSAKKYFVARAWFNAMTAANEEVEDHVVPPAMVYDRSFHKVTRTSAGGRVTCSATTYPDSGDLRPLYSCTLFDVTGVRIQNYDSQSGGCPSP